MLISFMAHFDQARRKPVYGAVESRLRLEILNGHNVETREILRYKQGRTKALICLCCSQLSATLFSSYVKNEPHHEKTNICICENKDTDQLRGNRKSDQRLCFCYIDITIP